MKNDNPCYEQSNKMVPKHQNLYTAQHEIHTPHFRLIIDVYWSDFVSNSKGMRSQNTTDPAYYKARVFSMYLLHGKLT